MSMTGRSLESLKWCDAKIPSGPLLCHDLGHAEPGKASKHLDAPIGQLSVSMWHARCANLKSQHEQFRHHIELGCAAKVVLLLVQKKWLLQKVHENLQNCGVLVVLHVSLVDQ